MHAREQSGIDAGVYLNEERFDLITRALGATSDVARARLLNVDPKTIYLARRGGVVGEKFIASAVHVLQQHASTLEAIGFKPAFEAMFDIRQKQVVV
jgi:hypothetical protein